jgi:hypothetical protein
MAFENTPKSTNTRKQCRLLVIISFYLKVASLIFTYCIYPIRIIHLLFTMIFQLFYNIEVQISYTVSNNSATLVKFV